MRLVQSREAGNRRAFSNEAGQSSRQLPVVGSRCATGGHGKRRKSCLDQRRDLCLKRPITAPRPSSLSGQRRAGLLEYGPLRREKFRRGRWQ
jgi:hypothetical protein